MSRHCPDWALAAFLFGGRVLAEVARDDQALLDSVPEFLTFEGLMMKATPAQEGDARIIYIQASNETRDAQGERVLRKALQDSAHVFKAYGNLDLDHYSMIGARQGIPNFHEYEIGRPVDVHFEGDRTFVKAALYQGDTPLARNANMVWDSMTKLSPPARWYPSVGGAVLSKAVETDPATGDRVPVVSAVRWTNLALSRTPVNQSVPVAQTVPFAALAKAWNGHGLVLSKTLTAGYGTDSATLTGGAALRTQSIGRKPSSYFDFRDRLAGDVRAKRAGQTAAAMTQHGTDHYGLDAAQAAEWTERFLADLRSGRTKRTTH